jgi:hypothetical protein
MVWGLAPVRWGSKLPEEEILSPSLTERLDAELPEPLPEVQKRERQQRVLVRQTLEIGE